MALTTSKTMSIILLSKREIEAIEKHLNGEFETLTTDSYYRGVLEGVILQAQQLLEETDEDSDGDLIQWYYNKFMSQININELELLIEKIRSRKPIDPKPEVGFCYMFKDDDTFSFNYILGIDEWERWDAHCLDYYSDIRQISSYHCRIDPMYNEEPNDCFPVSFCEFVQVCSMVTMLDD